MNQLPKFYELSIFTRIIVTRLVNLLTAGLLIFLFLSCSESTDNADVKSAKNPPYEFNENDRPPETSPFEWSVVSPTEHDVNPMHLETLLDSDIALPFLYAVVVIRGGDIIGEKYYNGKNGTDLNNIHSVTKSITSALTGVAYDHGGITDLNSKLVDYFPEYTDLTNYNELITEVTLYHLLTMQAGFDFEESLTHWQAYTNSPNWTEYVLQMDFMHDPGEIYHYSTPQTNILGNIVQHQMGMNLKEIADTFLFGPMGIDNYYWGQDPQGYYMAGHELYLTPRDMARFGLLYLNEGVWQGVRLISNSWFQASTSSQVMRYPPDEKYGYGYFWWTNFENNENHYSAVGKGGQYIHIYPERDLIIVTATNGDAWPIPIGQYDAIQQMVKNISQLADLPYN